MLADATAQSSQSNSIRFEHISTKDGLSQSTINDILQDKEGFLWFATDDGLNRYDGYEFKVFRNQVNDKNTLSSNQATVLLEDKEGYIWVGTNGGGLNKFNRETESFERFRHDPESHHSLSNNFITALFQDEEGVILVGTQNGLNILKPNTEDFTRYAEVEQGNGLRDGYITSLYKDSNDYIWIGTQQEGLYRFDRRSGEFKSFRYSASDPNTISDNWITVLYEDQGGRLWVGTQSGGLNMFNENNGTFIRYKNEINNEQSLSNNWVLSIYEDNYGTFWVGTLNGLNIHDRGKGIFTNLNDLNYSSNLSNNSITSLFEDRSGVFWVGTQNGALNKYVRSSSENFTIYQKDPSNRNSLSDNNIWAIHEDRDGIVWIGTQGGGLNRLDPETGNFTNYRHIPGNGRSLSNDFVNAIHKDRFGRLWVGTTDGLNRFNEETGTFEHFRHEPGSTSSISGNIITTIYEDSRGILWVGTLNNGLNGYDQEKERFVSFKNNPNDPESISHNKIWSMYEDRSGVFWVGTHGYGLNKYDRVREVFTRYTFDPNDENSISNNFINAITQDREGYIWIGTINGLNRFDPETEEFTRYTTEDGLPNNVIYGIIEDYRGHLWLSTNSGIADFDPKAGSIRIYDSDDGLPSNEYRFGAYHKGSNGTMYFGGINGVAVFKPDSIRDNPYVPPVVITNFQIFNKNVIAGAEGSPLKKAINETEAVTLSWRDNIFSFEFAALHYAAPRQNQYAYMMDGFESDWQYVGNRRFISYTNLPEGNYTFRVKAANKDGLWNEEGTNLKVKVMPPPWKSWWAYVAYFFSGGTLLIGFINYRVGKERRKKEKVVRHNEELEELVKERTTLLEHEKEKSDALLYNMLPQEVAEEIKENGVSTPRRYEEVSVLFTDFENFTTIAGSMSAKKLVDELNEIFENFDYIVEKFGLEKIKTIGDAYMAVSGLPIEKGDHALRCVLAAEEMLHYLEQRNKKAAVKWEMRIGVHSGSVIAGVVGKKKFTFDVWGPTVILASRMEEAGEKGMVNISAVTCDLVRDSYKCIYRGKIKVESQGDVDMYFLGERNQESSRLHLNLSN